MNLCPKHVAIRNEIIKENQKVIICFQKPDKHVCHGLKMKVKNHRIVSELKPGDLQGSRCKPTMTAGLSVPVGRKKYKIPSLEKGNP